MNQSKNTSFFTTQAEAPFDPDVFGPGGFLNAATMARISYVLRDYCQIDGKQ
jgi:hypothetical protein